MYIYFFIKYYQKISVWKKKQKTTKTQPSGLVEIKTTKSYFVPLFNHI